MKATFVKPDTNSFSWDPASSYEYDYDSLGRRTMKTEKQQDIHTGQWIPFSREVYSYDAQGREILRIRYRSYQDRGEIPRTKRETYYTDDGSISRKIISNWDMAIQDWYYSEAHFYRIGLSGKIVCDTCKTWNKEQFKWQNFQLVNYGTNAGQPSDVWRPEVEFKWKNNEWIPIDSVTTSFDPQTNSLTVHDKREFYDGNWADYDFTTRYFNASGKLEKLITGNYLDTAQALYGNSTALYFYNTDGDLVRMEAHIWNRKTKMDQYTGSWIYEYKLPDKTKTAPVQVKTGTDSISGTVVDEDIILTLTPDKNKLHISRNGSSSTSSTITIFDKRGKMAAEYSEKGTEIEIDVSLLPSGFYNLAFENTDDNIFVLKNLIISR